MHKILIAVTALAAAGTAHATNIVTNGGFESPIIGSSYVQYNAPSSAIAGWQVTNGSVDLVSAGYGPFPQGSQALDLVGDSNGTISQVLTTTLGQLYNLSFSYSNNPQAGVGTFGGNVSVGAFSSAFSHNQGDPYAVFTASFLGTGSDTLTFTSTAGQNNGGIFLDAISVSAAPEPATWAMMIGGFGIAGASLRRRRSKAAVSFG